MNTTFRWSVRGGVGAALAAPLAAAVIAVLVGCTTESGTAGNIVAVPVTSSGGVPLSSTPGARVVLRFDDRAVAATLADTAASREFAAMLPVTLELEDAWGQAKSARLPRPVPLEGAASTLKPSPGGIYYWPDTAALAVYYDDLGQSVPPPGLVRLGVVDTGLEDLAAAGRHVTVRIDHAS